MKQRFVLGLALATAVAVPALAAQPNLAQIRHHHGLHSLHKAARSTTAPAATAQVPSAAPALLPTVAPYPNGQGDEDGLSRDINDCNKGCIGGNPG